VRLEAARPAGRSGPSPQAAGCPRPDSEVHAAHAAHAAHATAAVAVATGGRGRLLLGLLGDQGLGGQQQGRHRRRVLQRGPHDLGRVDDAGEGLDAATGEYKDLIKAGIIDPAKVTRSALQNAASIAALFLTTEAVIADKPEKHPAPAGYPSGGMGGMDF